MHTVTTEKTVRVHVTIFASPEYYTSELRNPPRVKYFVKSVVNNNDFSFLIFAFPDKNYEREKTDVKTWNKFMCSPIVVPDAFKTSIEDSRSLKMFFSKACG